MAVSQRSLTDLLSELRGLARGSDEGRTLGRLRSIDQQLARIRADLDYCAELEEARWLVGEWLDRLAQTRV